MSSPNPRPAPLDLAQLILAVEINPAKAAPALLAECRRLRAREAALGAIVKRIADAYYAEQCAMTALLCSEGMIPHDLGQAARAALGQPEKEQ